ncbi:hypothetical protein ACO1PF_09685 [Alkalibacterium sp. f15]|uniref:hypothetical protein n=1 Tax=Alkalibacterium sp. f15 TaxID=3414029 RepID=UPI003BF79C3B
MYNKKMPLLLYHRMNPASVVYSSTRNCNDLTLLVIYADRYSLHPARWHRFSRSAAKTAHIKDTVGFSIIKDEPVYATE